MRNIILIATIVISFFTLAVAQTQTPWIHVRVEEGPGQETVKVNVPLNLVRTVLPLIEENDLNMGEVEISSRKITLSDMRQIWQEIKKEGSYELASVESEDANVRIVKEADQLIVRSTENSSTEILVQLPVQVVDALLSGEGEELNLVAALDELAMVGAGELVNVRDGDSHVRVWVDFSSSSE